MAGESRCGWGVCMVGKFVGRHYGKKFFWGVSSWSCQILIVGMWQLNMPPNKLQLLMASFLALMVISRPMMRSFKLNRWKEVEGSYVQTLPLPMSTSYATLANWPPIQRFYLTMAPIGTYWREGISEPIIDYLRVGRFPKKERLIGKAPA